LCRWKKKKSIIKWVKAHKKQLAIAGISTLVIVGIILGIKNNEPIQALWVSLKKSIVKVPAKMPECNAVTSTVIELPMASDISLPEATNAVRSYTVSTMPFDVNRHIRNLPEGWHPSPEKLAEAAELGIKLLLNQTLVDSYVKGGMAA